MFVLPLGGIGVAKAFSVASTCSSFEVLVDGSAVTVLRFEGGIDTAGADVGGRGLTVGFLVFTFLESNWSGISGCSGAPGRGLNVSQSPRRTLQRTRPFPYMRETAGISEK